MGRHFRRCHLGHSPDLGSLVELLPASEAHILELAVEASEVHPEALGGLGGLHICHGCEALLALQLCLGWGGQVRYRTHRHLNTGV